MTKIKTILALAFLLAVSSAQAGVKKIGTINGVDIYRVKTGWSLTCPNTTTVVAADPNQPGTFTVINSAAGPGVIPAAANAGGLVGAAALLRPNKTEVNNSGGNSQANSTATGSGNATTEGGEGWIPPGHRR